MKKTGTVLVIILVVVIIVLSFFAGDYLSDKKHTEDMAQRFNKSVSVAIDRVEKKGLDTEGVAEAVASDLWVAHELCEDPEISAELSNLWNELVYDEMYLGREEVLTAKLKDILQRYQ